MKFNQTYYRTLFRKIISLLLIPLLLCLHLPSAWANLRVPAWYDQNAVNLAPDWHYRVPINVPAGASINSTVVFDVDFNALLSTLGVNGTFDINSPRVVRSTGALSTNQQYTDAVFAGATDATGNNRGEVRFILQDAGAITYYLYFDITANGVKPVNPQVPINGNFEFGTVTGASPQIPLGWAAATRSNTTLEAQVRAAETVTVTENSQTVNTNGNPNTGLRSYLQGFRSVTDPGGNATLTRTIVVPATNPGSITIRIRPEGWDSSVNAGTNYDFMQIRLMNGATAALNIVTPALNNYATCPFSPNYLTSAITATNPGYGNYNHWDNGSGSNNHTLGMSATFNRLQEPWVTCTASLAAVAGQTLTLEVRSQYVSPFRSWFLIDDIEWSVVTATLGTPEGFGVNITSPTAASTFTTGQTISIIAQVNAQPTAAGNPVTADIYDNGGALVASGVILYNDGTHGDAVAGDNLWTNNGSVPANPTYTIPGGVPSGPNWLVRVYARDASTSTIGATNGLIHIPTLPNAPFSQANFYNVDEQLFTVNTVLLTNLKTVAVLSDPINGVSSPYYIPGAVAQYTILITNSGTRTVDNNTIVITDPIPANTTLFTGNVGGGAPYIFANGIPTSALTCPFVALNNPADCVDYSIDGGVSWTYVPNGDFDAAVTNIRFRLTGAMAANTGTGNPTFSIKFNVQVK